MNLNFFIILKHYYLKFIYLLMVSPHIVSSRKYFQKNTDFILDRRRNMLGYTVVLFISIFSILTDCAGTTVKTLVNDNTKKMLGGYRGSSGLKIAVLKSGEIEKKSESVSTEIINTVTQTLFNDGRFIIVER